MCMSQGPSVTASSDVEGCGTGWVPGRVYGWGIARWVPGWVIPVHPARCSGSHPDSEAGPGSLCRRLEWVVRVAGATGDGGGSQDHPAGPVDALRASPCPGTLIAASQPIRARLHLISRKVSQKDEVSPKYVEKACHSPYIQKRVQMSPLEILRFPLFAAFSPKELMGHI